MGTPEVGQDIEGLCGRCGQTWHVVMAKVGEQIAKVVCKRCGGHHGYRSAALQSAASDGGATQAADQKRPPGRGRFARPRRRRYGDPPPPAAPAFDPSKPPRAYAAGEVFAVGERITHTSFGSGVVSGSPGPGKVDIAFPSGARVLACAKVASTLERPTAAVNVPVADRPPK